MHMVHDTILEEEFILGGALDDEEEPEEAEEEGDAAIDDELLGELGDVAVEDEEELLSGVVDPLLKADESGFGEIGDHDDPEKEHAALDDEDDEEDMDYDSFDDHDEM